ncbi:hypothetical protein ACFLSW_02115 [Candidatus Bipolaricaulota bacterium]
MRNRGVGGVLVVFLLAFSIAVFSQTGLLYVNEEPLSLVHPVIEQGTLLLVPLEEFAPLIGLDVSSSGAEIVLRGDGFRQAYDEDLLYVQDGIPYTSLEWIIGVVDGETHWVGGDIYIQTQRPEIVEIEASTDRLVMRLTGFSPHVIGRSSQGLSDVLSLRWPHCLLGADAQLIRVGESDIQEVHVVEVGGMVELSITLEVGTAVALEQLESNDSYVLTIRVVETAFSESIIELDEGVWVHEWSDAANERSVDYVYVESWRDRFRLTPTVSTAGYQSTASTDAILRDNSAVSSISVDCAWNPTSAECLIMDGIPYLIPDTPSEVLAIDLFGRWTTFSSLCSVGIKHDGRLIEIDRVNQPLAYGEVAVYANGYQGGIVWGIPGSFTAIKIREERVVSVYQGPFVPEDSSAILVVASGEAKAKLSLIRLGDPLELVCQFVHAEGTYPHAISSGPRLMSDGAVSLSASQLAEISELPGGTLLACDWQGGLYLLAFEGVNSNDPELESWSLVDTLYSLPTTLMDAVLLSTCGQNAIAYSSASGTFVLGSRNPIRLALSLIPLTP